MFRPLRCEAGPRPAEIFGHAGNYQGNISLIHSVERRFLKVPQRENFELAIFTLCDPILVGDLWTEAKNRLFYQFAPDFDGFWFFNAC